MAKPKFAPGKAEPVYRGMLQRVGPAGLSSGDIAAELGISREAAGEYLRRMKVRGLAECRMINASTASARWYSPECAPAQQVVIGVKPRQKLMKPAKKPPVAASAGPMIIPAGLEVTRAPTPQSRYAFTPPPGWVGEITKDWMASRVNSACVTGNDAL